MRPTSLPTLTLVTKIQRDAMDPRVGKFQTNIFGRKRPRLFVVCLPNGPTPFPPKRTRSHSLAHAGTTTNQPRSHPSDRHAQMQNPRKTRSYPHRLELIKSQHPLITDYTHPDTLRTSSHSHVVRLNRGTAHNSSARARSWIGHSLRAIAWLLCVRRRQGHLLRACLLATNSSRSVFFLRAERSRPSFYGSGRRWPFPVWFFTLGASHGISHASRLTV